MLCVIFGLSCSTGRNTSSSRAYHELKTRFNIYHNAKEAYYDILTNQLTVFPSNTYELLSFYSFNDVKEKTGIGGPFDIVIEKVEKAINEHSISAKPIRDPSKAYSKEYRKWLKQEEFNPFISNAWLLLGKAHVQNGDYDQALLVFSKIVKMFPDDIDITSEAQLWMLIAYTEMNRFYDAQNLIYILRTRKMPNELEILFNESYSHYLLKSMQFNEAIPYIRNSIDNEKNTIRKKRLLFMLGQVYTLTEDYENAYNTFNRFKKINTPKELYLNAFEYQQALSSGEQQSDSIANLLKQNLFKTEINTLANTNADESINYSNTKNLYKDSFQLYWEAHLKRNIISPVGIANPNVEVEKEFIADNLSPHMLLLLPSDQSVKINKLLFSTANFNFTNYKLLTFDLSLIRLNKRDALKLEQFSSLREASKYLSMLQSDTIYRASLSDNVTPIIISKKNFDILQNKTLDDYEIFYEDNIDSLPKDLLPIKVSCGVDDLFQVNNKTDDIFFKESLLLNPNSNYELDTVHLKTSDIKFEDVKTAKSEINNLKSSLEQKAEQMKQQTTKPTNSTNRAKELKKREHLRKERIKQHEQEIKQREKKREMEIKQREKERELKLRAQKRDH